MSNQEQESREETMSKPSCLLAIMSDGSGLTVKVSGDKVVVDVREIHNYFEEEWEGPMFEVYEKVFSQEFDFSGLPWKSERHKELLAELVRGRIMRTSFKKFAEPIARLAQKLAIQNEVYGLAAT